VHVWVNTFTANLKTQISSVFMCWCVSVQHKLTLCCVFTLINTNFHKSHHHIIIFISLCEYRYILVYVLISVCWVVVSVRQMSPTRDEVFVSSWRNCYMARVGHNRLSTIRPLAPLKGLGTSMAMSMWNSTLPGRVDGSVKQKITLELREGEAN